MTQQPPYIPPAPGKKGMSGGVIAAIIGGVVLVVVLICGGAVMVMLPALSKAREAARQVVSSANMQRISIGLQQYAADHDGMLPEAGADLSARLARYGVPAGMFTSPNPPPTGPSYFYVPQGNLEKLANPSAAVLMYENPAIPSTIGWNVAFADGSVQLLDPDRYHRTINTITLPDGTPYVPQ
ncbi:MAG: hypothetical protein HBSAPP03_07630 [Phycisphaerae bacterium]|nr:MAG: hypothetical protein HBSAPP03_07630 [Phycisphaerae bacterium]